jgi:hypothetical protein
MVSKLTVLTQAQSFLSDSITAAWKVSINSSPTSPKKINALHLGLHNYVNYYINYLSGNKNLQSYDVWFQLEDNENKTYRLPELHNKNFNVDGALIKSNEVDKQKTKVVFSTKMPLTSIQKNIENILNCPFAEYSRRIAPKYPEMFVVQINFIPTSSYAYDGKNKLYFLEPKITFNRTFQLDETGSSYAHSLPFNGKNFFEVNITYDIPLFSQKTLSKTDFKSVINDTKFSTNIVKIDGLSRTLKMLENL